MRFSVYIINSNTDAMIELDYEYEVPLLSLTRVVI